MSPASPFDLPSPGLPKLPPRAAESHKGDYGSGLLIGGSRGMTGAIGLAGMSAVCGGAGLVRLAIPDGCLETVASYSPCYMTIPLRDQAPGQIAMAAWEQLATPLAAADCVAVGPGLGQAPQLRSLLSRLVRTVGCPLVIDADGLNNLAEVPGWGHHRPAATVITPHPGEWSRLCGVPASERTAQCQAAIEFARQSSIVVVLKGTQTLITNGTAAVINTTGTPAMATGGSGDVLTGLITALICQGLSPFEAAHLGVHVHGLAAQLAELSLRAHVVPPTDLIQHLPAAFAEVRVVAGGG